jgi:hypothetical protein
MARIWFSSAAIWDRAPAAVQQPGHRAQQVPEQVARPGLRRDVQVDGVEVHLQAEQVQVERLQSQVRIWQDAAAAAAAVVPALRSTGVEISCSNGTEGTPGGVGQRCR